MGRNRPGKLAAFGKDRRPPVAAKRGEDFKRGFARGGGERLRFRRSAGPEPSGAAAPHGGLHRALGGARLAT